MKTNMKTIGRMLFAAALLAAAPAAAQAQIHVAPFIGTTFGGDATKRAPTTGLAVGWLGEGSIGFAADLGVTPGFFEQDGFLITRRVTTLMGNVVFAPKMSGMRAVRLFASGGFGLIHAKLAEAGELFVADAKKAGFNVGGGVLHAYNEHIGALGDIRYFRTIGESDVDDNAFGVDFSKFGFWRGAIALVVRF